MSSLAADRADNFYYPPEWTPQQGSLNKFHGQHALRERAKKIDQGILCQNLSDSISDSRFEMPFNIWCGGCNSMIAKGVRFNAEKKQVGNYYSTKIWSFSMKSAWCKNEIVIQTDPKNCEYVIISGAQKKTEDFDVEDYVTWTLQKSSRTRVRTHGHGDIIRVRFGRWLSDTSISERGKLSDPFYPLEHQEEDI